MARLMKISASKSFAHFRRFEIYLPEIREPLGMHPLKNKGSPEHRMQAGRMAAAKRR
ncbi:hypothetical protein ACFFP0_06600 [Rhizobium puerariae]|uniref:Uncharacterized protein n=1 Tax=Rhizobium puerariae TaxID=1585791 RepID=A0ABV6AD06_9HYPH